MAELSSLRKSLILYSSFLGILFLIWLFPACLVFADPTKESLIQAWEQAQKNDSETVTLEKIETNRYRFETKRFSFQGELKVLNVTIGDMGLEDTEDGYLPGWIEVELVDAPQDLAVKQPYSYSAWEQNNVLYYDKSQSKWVSAKDFRAGLVHKSKNWNRSPLYLVAQYSWVALIGLILLLAAYVGRIAKRANKQVDETIQRYEKAIQLSEKSIQISEDSNKVLKEILQALKGSSEKRE